jgi:DNA-binding helix-hairpin-helix protein with protein kinase domain
MAVLTCSETNQTISLLNRIARSGEGEVWQTQIPGCLAKIYYFPHPERINKLKVMVAHPPKDPNAHINHISFAWPKSLLQDQAGNCVGFLMPAIANSVDLLDVYSPLRRRIRLPDFNWLYLHTTALNVASLVWAIHWAGYVLGDIKPQNILVNNQALPAIIDTDSFQVRHPKSGQLYHCLVGSESFTPVELLGQDLATIEQTEVHDRFRLGVIIYLLLFGDYPFKGKWMAEGESPPPTELLRQGYWPYAPNSPIKAGPLTIPLKVIHPELQSCFLRCFNDGHRNPSLRPSAHEWFQALKVATTELKACRRSKHHYYSKTHGKCYWCQRKAKLGTDIFPGHVHTTEPLKKRALRRIKGVTQGLKSHLAYRLPLPLTRVSLAVLRNVRTALQQTLPPAQSLLSKLNPAQNSTVRNLSTPLTMGLKVTITVLGLPILLGLPAMLMQLSDAKMDESDSGLTLVGLTLFIGLVSLCSLWAKLSDRPQT